MIFFSNRGWLGTGFAILMFLILSIIITSMGRKIIINSGRTVDSMREKQAYWNARVGRSVVDREGEEGQGIIEFGGGTVLFDDLCVIGSSAEVVSGGSLISLQSDDFDQGETLEANHRLEDGCGGLNQSPQLNWSGVPEDAASLVIILSDADADNFTHWAMYNIPKATSSLARNAAAPAGATELDNYAGPCPPVNDGINHRYVFKIYALNASIGGSPADIAALRT
ncbi:MAG: YbhB/YbcL family Raf kinase inhibitor-like protein, partial [Candidatus Marinimicrobia bacterium]|nr:YbhB/YbcL family Raf kinase inhibitor-like protein [Candidatus Neomarinimicrobiota bacterium]